MNGPHNPQASPFALLLVAHGERGGRAANAGLWRLADALARRQVAPEVGVGLIKGTPTVGETLRGLGAKDVAVYPVLGSDGYFVRVRLPQLLAESGAGERVSHVFAPLGLDPALAAIVARRLESCAKSRRVQTGQADVILMAHGSRRDPASRIAAQTLANRLAEKVSVRSIGIALLEEPPSLRHAASKLIGPILVVGLFFGDGMHGAEDMQSEIALCNRADILFAGNIGQFAEIEDVIAGAVARFDRESVHGRPIAQ